MIQVCFVRALRCATAASISPTYVSAYTPTYVSARVIPLSDGVVG